MALPVLGAVALLAVPKVVAEHTIKAELQEFLCDAFDATVTIDSVSVSVLGYLSIWGIKIANLELPNVTWKSPEMFRLDEVQVDCNLPSFFAGGKQNLCINEIMVKGFHLSYESVDGKCNVERLQKYLPAPEQARATYQFKMHARKKKHSKKKKKKNAQEEASKEVVEVEQPVEEDVPQGTGFSAWWRRRRGNAPSEKDGEQDPSTVVTPAESVEPVKPEPSDDPESPQHTGTKVTLKRVTLGDLSVTLTGPVQLDDDNQRVTVQGLAVKLDSLCYDDFAAIESEGDPFYVVHHFAINIMEKVAQTVNQTKLPKRF